MIFVHDVVSDRRYYDVPLPRGTSRHRIEALLWGAIKRERGRR
jgi:hypothetical protein